MALCINFCGCFYLCRGRFYIAGGVFTLLWAFLTSVGVFTLSGAFLHCCGCL
jgi:hypothetical protein